MIIDSHCHLNMKEFAEDLDVVVQNAKAAGVEYMQTICTKLEDLDGILAIAEKYPNIFASVGVHPHEVDNVEELDTLDERIKNLARHPKIIGIGETGLDYYYEHGSRDNQKKAFLSHIHASQEMQLPIIVHTRSADEDTIDILTEEMKNKPFPGLIHCFSSSEDLGQKCVDIGMYISISGMITFKNADDLRGIISRLPLDRLLVETDSPYLAPIPMRGKRSEPAYTRFVAEKIAEIYGLTPAAVAEKTTENFWNLFKKAASFVQSR
ncbi:MAG: TatD family hydrolase [Pseudomonadota bacterium]